MTFLEWAFLFFSLIAAVAVPVALWKRTRRTVNLYLRLLLAPILGLTIAYVGLVVWVNYMMLPCDAIAIGP